MPLLSLQQALFIEILEDYELVEAGQFHHLEDGHGLSAIFSSLMTRVILPYTSLLSLIFIASHLPS